MVMIQPNSVDAAMMSITMPVAVIARVITADKSRNFNSRYTKSSTASAYSTVATAASMTVRIPETMPPTISTGVSSARKARPGERPNSAPTRVHRPGSPP